jgi:diguanylate cyclase (GGDEF)-like protein
MGLAFGKAGMARGLSPTPSPASSLSTQARPKRHVTTAKVHVAPRPPFATPLQEELEAASLCETGGKSRSLITVLAGEQLGKIVAVEGDLVIGRGEHADVRFTDPGISWRHARLLRREDAVFVEDLGSTNGTFVHGQRVSQPRRLTDGDQIRLGGHTVLKYFVADRLEEAAAQSLYESAVRDPLTGVHNRRYLIERLASEISFALRHAAPLAVLFIDVDHFKRVNDLFGHAVGDATLRVITMTIQRMIRPEDVLSRYGGEEFVVIARSVTPRNAEILAERIRRRIGELELPLEGEPALSVSIGVAALAGLPQPDAAALVSAADQAMYAAKERGRNCVVSR